MAKTPVNASEYFVLIDVKMSAPEPHFRNSFDAALAVRETAATTLSEMSASKLPVAVGLRLSNAPFSSLGPGTATLCARVLVSDSASWADITATAEGMRSAIAKAFRSAKNASLVQSVSVVSIERGQGETVTFPVSRDLSYKGYF